MDNRKFHPLSALVHERMNYFFISEGDEATIKVADPHPLLSTSNLYGTAVFYRKKEKFILDIFHGLNPAQEHPLKKLAEISLARSMITFDKRDLVHYETCNLRPIPSTLPSQLNYSRTAYLPGGIIQDIRSAKEGKVSQARKLTASPELVDFIDYTANL